jgi:Uma2 family endonuclease
MSAVLSTSPLVKTYTLEEFWDLPEPKDGTKLELIAGVLYMSPPPRSRHNVAMVKLNHLFIGHLYETGAKGRVFVPRAALWTGRATYVEPDLFYLSETTLQNRDLEHLETADLVVEVISPGTALYDRNTKSDTYAALGVNELWLVDPEHKIVEVRQLNALTNTYDQGAIFQIGDRVTSQVLPRFKPTVDELCKTSLL